MDDCPSTRACKNDTYLHSARREARISNPDARQMRLYLQAELEMRPSAAVLKPYHAAPASTPSPPHVCRGPDNGVLLPD